MQLSAGLLMYRIKDGVPEILLVHPGGPFWKHKDEGAWDIPKGGGKEGESDTLEIAKREFEEETGLRPEGKFEHLTSVKRSSGQVIDVWSFEGDWDPANLVSNTCFVEWPPSSGEKIEIPEVDRGGFFTIEEAKKKVYKYHLQTLEAFEKFLGSRLV
jgi:predicted NUDIX family NTP pyrophosphohydrolase